jgi:hypothetical protein
VILHHVTEGWPFAIEGSGIRYRHADPTDPAIDNFNAGAEPWAVHVAEYFRERRWLTRDRTCYQFGLDGAPIGYAAVALAPCAHPDESSSAKATYLIIFMIGVDVEFQGATNQSTGRSYFASIIDEVHRIATEVVDCVGLYLIVDRRNARAVRAYLRSGFFTDPSPAGTKSKGGRTFLTMRRARTSAAET